MCYSPKIREELVRKLYTLKHSNGDRIPMTKMVNEAIIDYLNKKAKEQINETKYRSG